MDFRVLIAVFVTLFAIAVGMANGDIDQQNVATLTDQLQGLGDLSQLLDMGFQSTKPANISLTAALTATGENTIELQRQAALSLELDDGTAVTVGDATLTATGGPVRFTGFSGTATFDDDTVRIDGETTGVETAGASFNYTASKEVTVAAAFTEAAFTGIDSDTIRLVQVDGTVQSGGSTVQESQQAVFEYFDGDITVAGGTFEVDGKVYRAVLGAGNPPVIIGQQ